MTKVNYYEYLTLKENIKFLEFYWYEYNQRNKHPEKYPYKDEIEHYIAQDYFEKIQPVRITLLHKRVVLTSKCYHMLCTYSFITDDLKQKLAL